jgi:predicted transposase/invertase (TIGR01784 family)
MTYVDPQSDIAFKKLFGEASHKHILISFLNSVLERTEGTLIVDVLFTNTQNMPDTVEGKMSIVDVRCTDEKNNQYIVEMQVSAQHDYAARAQYYSSLALSRQLEKGQRYSRLVPVIFIGVLNFNLVPEKEYLNHYLITNTESGSTGDFKHLEFHLIELKKFDTEITEASSLLEKWLFFLKNALSLDAIPKALHEPVLEDAFGILERGNWSVNELEKYDKYLDSMRSHESIIETAIAMGIEKGIEKGLETGKKERSLEIARKLLGILDNKTIAEKTGLSIDEVEKLTLLY